MAHKIKVRRGLKKDLPVLDHAEPAFCTDTEELYIGSNGKNVLLTVNTQQLLAEPTAAISSARNAAVTMNINLLEVLPYMKYYKEFTSTQNWTVPETGTYCVIAVGGGKGGTGGGQVAGASTGPGGRAGALAIGVFELTANQSISVTIGTGGAGGTVASGGIGNAGGNGTASSFGSLLSGYPAAQSMQDQISMYTREAREAKEGTTK